MSDQIPPYSFTDGKIVDVDGNVVRYLAIAFDAEHGTVFKHGQAQRVEDWATATRLAYADTGMSEYAEALTVITFTTTNQITVDTANKAILYVGWLLREQSRLQGGTPSQPKLLDCFA